jgi:hypothetical protein
VTDNATPPAEHNVIRAINEITAELAREGISKNRQNQQQGFKFRGIEDVYAALAHKLAAHKLAILPIVEERIETVRTSSKGGNLYSVALRVRYEFWSASGGASWSATMWGEAMDSGDKATSKAASMAYKYMAFQVFCIPVAGQDDADAETPPPSKPAAEQSGAAKKAAHASQKAAPVEPYDNVAFALTDIKNAKTEDALKAIGHRLKESGFTGQDDADARSAYKQRMVDLREETK